MKINFECKGCKKEFDCEMGTIGINEATMRPNFEKPFVKDKVLLFRCESSEDCELCIDFSCNPTY